MLQVQDETSDYGTHPDNSGASSIVGYAKVPDISTVSSKHDFPTEDSSRPDMVNILIL